MSAQNQLGGRNLQQDPTLSDAEAKAILLDMRRRAGTLFRALDRDGDGVLSAQEIDAAPEVLRALDLDGDGYLQEQDFGGPTDIPGLVRRSGIVKVLDADGDLVIGPDDIADAANRIRALDTDGDGCVTLEDDLPQPGKHFERRMPMGSPAEILAYQRKLFTRAKAITGPLPPTGRAGVQPGYLLIHEVGDRGDMQKSQRTYLMDEHGEIAHEWTTLDRHPEATVAYLQPDGTLLKTTSTQSWITMDGRFPIGSNGCISALAPDSQLLWQMQHFEIDKEVLHHDFEVMPNGNLLVICYCIMPVREAYALGWQHQSARKTVVLDKIYEIKPDYAAGTRKIVWEWRAEDHFVQDRDPALPNYGKPADHPERIDINWLQFSEAFFNSGQMFHANSISYSEKDDVILLSSALFSEIWAIDHSTSTEQARGSTGGQYGRGGDLLWRYGNPQTHGRGGPSDQILYWQHDAHFIPRGTPASGEVLIFNNGMKRNAQGGPDPDQMCMGLITGAYSDVLEISLPRGKDGKIQIDSAPTLEWSFNAAGEHGFYSPFMSGAQRMPNGNTLMCQASDKRIVEVDPSGAILLDFHLGGPGRLYRIYKYAPNDPAIIALGL